MWVMAILVATLGVYLVWRGFAAAGLALAALLGAEVIRSGVRGPYLTRKAERRVVAAEDAAADTQAAIDEDLKERLDDVSEPPRGDRAARAARWKRLLR